MYAGSISALSRPEANEPFRTEVWHDGVIEHDTLQGNLYVVGGFDPEFDSQSMDLYKDKMAVISISEDPKARRKEYIKTKGMGGNQWNELRKGRTGLALNYQVRGIPHYEIGRAHV